VNNGLILGIIGGVAVFIISLTLIMYINSDLDKKLIEEMGSGVPTNVVYNQIDNDTQNQKSIAKGDLDSHVMNPTDWEKKGLVTDDNYEYYIQIYNSEIGFISKYNQIRKEYVTGKISKEEFLEESKTIQDDLNNFSM
jgi:lipopolysaccharide export LptBFGC system permease protein LptF